MTQLTTTTAFAAALNKLDAPAAGKALRALLPQLLKSSLREEVNADFDLVGYKQVGPLDESGAAEVLGYLDKLDTAGRVDDVVREITACLSVTAARERDGLDLRMMINTLLDGTSEFPVDIIVSACRRYAKANRFWPTLAEIRSYCLEEARWRRSLRAVCERAVSAVGRATHPPSGNPPAGKEWKDLTEAERAEIDAKLAETKAKLSDGPPKKTPPKDWFEGLPVEKWTSVSVPEPWTQS
jgi:hypothetical protein